MFTYRLRLAMASVPVGIASLVGTPIAAAIVGDDHQWWKGSVFTGVGNTGFQPVQRTDYTFRPDFPGARVSCIRAAARCLPHQRPGCFPLTLELIDLCT